MLIANCFQKTYPCIIWREAIGDVSLLSGGHLSTLWSLLVKRFGLVIGWGKMDKVLADVCVGVPILGWVIAVYFQTILPWYG